MHTTSYSLGLNCSRQRQAPLPDLLRFSRQSASTAVEQTRENCAPDIIVVKYKCIAMISNEQMAATT